ncbi:hypothetical protein EKO27_g5567 [Xylaria grammica]|uniref:Flavodoxin-like fold domain-containing protein n=1 Tax=Xylaria grammica TaxID=363999 RepID=A0A439D580_9PEZI|nr:hypothetical protein EKO27_g5567 [Xylaria grammica]
MKVLVVLAHPEPQSLNGALFRVTIDEMKAQGHEVQVSDLYAMQWKSQVDRADFPQLSPDARFKVMQVSREATASNSLTDDVKREQEKLLWADAVIFHFPFWWLGMPAILKGWFERVFSLGFGYGIGEHSNTRWAGRSTVPLGVVCGPIDDLLFPVNHGMLYYTGFDVLPSLVVYRADRSDEAAFQSTAGELRQRLRTLSTTKPIGYRRQNGGDYEIPTLMLKPELGGASDSGFSLHTVKE